MAPKVGQLDEKELRPGLPWQEALERQIENIQSAAVFTGARGIGPWQHREIEALIRQFVDRGCPAIPAILEGCRGEPQLPLFLKLHHAVDFRKSDPDPIDQLVWGITGEKP